MIWGYPYKYHLERIDGDRHSHERLGLSWLHNRVVSLFPRHPVIPPEVWYFGYILVHFGGPNTFSAGVWMSRDCFCGHFLK